jgi:hypothetical protein
LGGGQNITAFVKKLPKYQVYDTDISRKEHYYPKYAHIQNYSNIIKKIYQKVFQNYSNIIKKKYQKLFQNYSNIIKKKYQKVFQNYPHG